MIRRFNVTAFWDPEAKVWCSETDIRGLVIETATLDEFEEVMNDLAPDMVAANHSLEPSEAQDNSPDVIVITWERPPLRIVRDIPEAA